MLVGVGRLVERGVGYNSKLDMTGLKDESGLELELFDHFGPDELEARHKLLFKLVGIIWKREPAKLQPERVYGNVSFTGAFLLSGTPTSCSSAQSPCDAVPASDWRELLLW